MLTIYPSYFQKESVEFKVITPLNRLLTMFQGPIKVIKKRHDKLLDYDNLSSRVKNIRDQEQLRCVSLLELGCNFETDSDSFLLKVQINCVTIINN